MSLQQHIRNVTPKQLFLIDALGALVSAIMLGLVLTRFEATFGMPQEELRVLALLASIFFLYSFSCYLRTPANWRPFLRGIAIVNLLYCGLTIGLMVRLHDHITVLGYVYFVSEVMIIVVLARIELTATARPEEES